MEMTAEPQLLKREVQPELISTREREDRSFLVAEGSALVLVTDVRVDRFQHCHHILLRHDRNHDDT